MTFTNRQIFSDLHNQGSNPSLSNKNYKSDVEVWLWNHLDTNKECQILSEWVEKTSVAVSDYAKKIYSTSGYSVRNILSGTRHNSWLDTSDEFPSNANCQCPGCQPKDENTEVNIKYNINKIICSHVQISKLLLILETSISALIVARSSSLVGFDLRCM